MQQGRQRTVSFSSAEEGHSLARKAHFPWWVGHMGLAEQFGEDAV
jgi:hypothetical protein